MMSCPYLLYPIPHLHSLLTILSGEPGLREATGLAILNANYMAKRIEEVHNDSIQLYMLLLSSFLFCSPVESSWNVKRFCVVMT